MNVAENVLITGGSGFIGRHLSSFLSEHGYCVWVLTRNPEKTRKVLGKTVHILGSLDEALDVRFSAVINFAGESLASRRWSESSKRAFRESRITFTERLYQFFERTGSFPDVLLNASAVGFYGNCYDQLIDETAREGGDFAAQLCADWELAAKQFERHSVRVCYVRLGVVLESDGGALKQMLPAFRLGVGGRLGAGQHYMPWIHRQDVLRLFLFLLRNDRAFGAVNAVAPEAVNNIQFTKALADCLRRPALLPMPEFVLRLLFGEMADALLLSSQRATPAAALSFGFEFDFPQLHQAFSAILKK
ncbi:TIGR01777 family oxidoreductase [Cellvibrio sp. UBA7661]|uniref:TIGR01777 family oxidoreductase n=1 Tax=Cellvibrio sp. UBA7661 TaxID=1946311 RepID=UPI002F352FF8